MLAIHRQLEPKDQLNSSTKQEEVKTKNVFDTERKKPKDLQQSTFESPISREFVDGLHESIDSEQVERFASKIQFG